VYAQQKSSSLASGFENNTHFSRVFKEKFGTSPLQYKNQFLPAPVSF
jgi:transcriptional regulator GlxA family with amidase domain